MIEFDDLTQGQQLAFDTVMEAIETKKFHVTVKGYAGTGKTTLTKFIINELVKRGVDGIMLAAPTHAAKKVLANLSGMEANTIHSILKINPTTYEDTNVFEQKEVPDLAGCRVLVCDEGSMYDRKLYNIMMNTIPSWCTVIALGDDAQLRPVEPGSTEGSISPFFTDQRFKVVSLTEVMRSNAPIIKVATDIRNGSFIYEHLDENGVGVKQFTGDTAFVDFLKTYLSKIKTPQDVFENRMVAFTNKSVDKLNKIIRKKIYQTDEPFVLDEIIVMQEPLMVEHNFGGKTLVEVLFNNGEYVKVKNIKTVTDEVRLPGVSDAYLVTYYKLAVESIDTGLEAELNVIVDEHEYDKYSIVLGKAASAYKSGQVKASWKAYWKMRRKFIKVRPLPCGTIHKSQGMTVDNIFVYTPCIHTADGQLAQQLLYVAATRARNEVYFV